MKDELIKEVSFDLIRYANCWEDAEVLIKGLDPVEGSKLLSIGSAGDNSFSLLLTEPELVVAIDINRVQLYLIELKKRAMIDLDYEEVLAFLGFSNSDKRIATFNLLKGQLTNDARRYWETQMDLIEPGIIHQGKFERYFQFFSRRILPLIHSAQSVDKLLEKKSVAEQEIFFTNSWDTWRWRGLFKLFFSKFIMGKFGRDPQFLKEVNIPVSNYILEKAASHLRSQECHSNFILHYNLKGSFGDLLPHYLQPDHYGKIISNLDRMTIMEGYAEKATKSYGVFDGMNLSNIFEYMNMDVFRQTASNLVQGLSSGGRMAYWNLMVPRYISREFPEQITRLEALSKEVSDQDRGFFYNQFIIDHKIG